MFCSESNKRYYWMSKKSRQFPDSVSLFKNGQYLFGHTVSGFSYGKEKFKSEKAPLKLNLF